MNATLTRSQMMLTGALLEVVEVAQDKADANKQSIRLRFHTGDIIPHEDFGQLAVDLEGMRISKQRMPILLDHKPDQIVGFTDTISKSATDGLVAHGALLRNTDHGKHVEQLRHDGFPWQCSMWAPFEKLQVVRPGEKASVNGREMTGPGVIVRKSRLREVTVTALGKDENTDISALSGGSAESVTVAIDGDLAWLTAEPQGQAEENMNEAKNGVPPLSLDTLRASHADVFTAAAQEGAKSERTRVLAILNSCSEGQQKLAAELIESGASEVDALRKANSDLRSQFSAKLDELRNKAPKSAGTDDAPEKFTEDKAAVDADNKARAEVKDYAKLAEAALAADPKLRKQFGEAKYYASYLKLEAQTSGGR